MKIIIKIRVEINDTENNDKKYSVKTKFDPFRKLMNFFNLCPDLSGKREGERRHKL